MQPWSYHRCNRGQSNGQVPEHLWDRCGCNRGHRVQPWSSGSVPFGESGALHEEGPGEGGATVVIGSGPREGGGLRPVAARGADCERVQPGGRTANEGG